MVNIGVIIGQLNVDILSSFEEMDEYLQIINFEHGNSIRKYKKNISQYKNLLLLIIELPSIE